jgi:predicted HTH transcriptional regulator
VEENGVMVVTLYKNIQDEEYLKKFNLNHRQIDAVEYVKSNGRITNHDYRKINNISKRTASRDLHKLVSPGIFHKSSNTGQSTSYKLEINEGENIISKGYERAILANGKLSMPNSQINTAAPEETKLTDDNTKGVVIQEDERFTDQVTGHDSGHNTPHDTPHDKKMFSDLQNRLIKIFDREMSRVELMEKQNLNDRENFRLQYLEPLLNAKLIERTIPEKPKSKNQKYRLTHKGKRLQKKLKRKQ